MKNPIEELPLNAWKALEPFLDKKGQLFEKQLLEGNLIGFKSIRFSFSFNIVSYIFQNNIHHFKIKYSPTSANNTGPSSKTIKSSELDQYFSNWITILEGYDKVRTIHDDEILDSFENDFYSEFTFEETEDPDVVPLPYKNALAVDKLLEHYCIRIEDFKTSENFSQIEEIKENAKEIRENLTLKPKNWSAKKISKLFAKTFKTLGVKAFQDFISQKMIESTTWFFNSGVKNLPRLYDQIDGVWDVFPG